MFPVYSVTNVPGLYPDGRLTWQINEKNKLTLSESVQAVREFWQIDTPTRAPEAASNILYPNKITQVTWSHPATSRLLFEAGTTILLAEQDNTRMPDVSPNDIPVTELSTGLNYNARATVGSLGTSDYGVGQGRSQ